MKKEKKEKRILMISFVAGLMFAIVEYIFAIFSSSQSVLMDAVYDATELIFIALILFLTPLFYKPVSEKHPYGFYQIETIFLVVKCFMMIAVSLSVSVEVIESAVKGGNHVNEESISVFQFILGLISIVVFLVMKKMNKSLSSPTVDTEILEWKLDIGYSLGLSIAFFGAMFLEKTPLAFISPYFDQIVAVLIMLLMLPETVKILWRAIKDIFLFSPSEETYLTVKSICTEILNEDNYTPTFFDITRTGRHMWIEIYFETEDKFIEVSEIQRLSKKISDKMQKAVGECTCELILSD